MKPLNSSENIPANQRRIAKSIFSFKKLNSARLTASATSVALGALLVIWTLSASMFWRGGSVAAFAEQIGTYDVSSCASSATPKTTFVLGDKVWATVTGAPGAPTFGVPQRSFQWIAPDFTLAKQEGALAATDCDDYDLPTTGPFAQTGTWIVRTVDNSANGVAYTTFVVRDPTRSTADVSVSIFGPSKGSAGGSLSYRVEVTNKGPDTAEDITLTDPVPANTTFVSSTGSCTDPAQGCAIASLAAGDTATFTFVYNINSGTPNETLITNTVQVSSPTEPNGSSQSNNSSTAVSSVVNQGASPCTISCPADINANNAANQCTAIVTFATPTPSGSCTDSGTGQTVPVTCNPPSGSVFPIGETSVTCSPQTEGTNVSGNACSFTVTVHDTRPPVQPTITCPSTVTASENPPGSDSANVDYPAPTASGNCVTTFCDPPSGSGFRVGTTAVTCTTTDSSNNTVSCTFNVVVTSGTCGLDCPPNKTVNESSPGSGSANVTYSTPTTVGTCPAVTITCVPASGSTFSVGTTPVNCTARDGSSNVVASCNFTVTVTGSSACTITCPANVTASENPSGSGSATVTYATPTSTGSCAGSVVCTPPSGASFPIGSTTVNCTRSDPAGNPSTCSFKVTVTGGTPCTIVCPSNLTLASAACGNVVTYSAPVTSGSCGDPGDPTPWTCNPPSGSFFPVGSTIVTCAADVGTQCSFTVTITGTDAVPPAIVSCALSRTSGADSACQAVVPNFTSDVEALDNCTPSDLLTITQSPLPGTVVGPGPHTITITVKDANLNSVSCTTTFTVTSEPSDPPTLSCPSDITTSNSQNQCGTVVTYTVPTGSSSNPCLSVTVACSPASGAPFPIGTQTVLCTATDILGNTATCTFQVTVNDTQLPTITCPANITKSNDADHCYAVVSYDSPVTADNCPGVTTVCSPASGAQFSVGTTTVVCTATDASQNTKTCSFTVTVNDTQDPKITCPSDIEVGLPLGASTVAVTYQPTVSDNCTGATYACTPASGSAFAAGTTTVNCTATDTAGHTAACSFTVTVSDNQPPTITCPAGITQPNTLNQCGAAVTYPAPTVTDNSPGATATCSPVSGSVFPVGVTIVTCTATDVGSNHSNCSFTVTVVDTQLPAITCPANITVGNTTGLCSATVNVIDATATDNCPGVTVVGTRSDGLALNAAYPVGTTTIVWTARDAAGNQSSCTQTIVVNDTEAPTITGAVATPSTLWPPNHKMVDVTISYSLSDNCTASAQVTSALSVTSNEGTSADWQIIDSHHLKLLSERLGEGNGRIYTITITATDSKGNSSTKTVTVTVPHNQ